MYFAEELWGPGKANDRLKSLLDWLKTLECYKVLFPSTPSLQGASAGLQAAKQAVGTGTVDERVIGIIQGQISELQASKAVKKIKLGVKTTVLYRVSHPILLLSPS